MTYFIGAAILTFGVVLIMGLAFYNRDDPAWQRDMSRIGIIVFGQIALIAFLLVLGALNPG
jgi:hypothetical protein